MPRELPPSIRRYLDAYNAIDIDATLRELTKDCRH